MGRRFLQHKEPDCPAIVLFRYFDRETIRIFEDADDDENEDDYVAYFRRELLVKWVQLIRRLIYGRAARLFSALWLGAKVRHKLEPWRPGGNGIGIVYNLPHTFSENFAGIDFLKALTASSASG